MAGQRGTMPMFLKVMLWAALCLGSAQAQSILTRPVTFDLLQSSSASSCAFQAYLSIKNEQTVWEAGGQGYGVDGELQDIQVLIQRQIGSVSLGLGGGIYAFNGGILDSPLNTFHRIVGVDHLVTSNSRALAFFTAIRG